MKQLDYLKKEGGPFTTCDEVDEYLAKENINIKMKKKRMKMEVQYSRDSSLSLPKNNPVFRIRKKKAKGSVQKLQDLSPQEFGENLKILISKKFASMNRNVSIETFFSTMESILLI